MNEESKQIISEVIKYKGKDFAVLCVVEEFAELSKELLKDINRGKNNTEDIIEEIADVTVMLEYLKQLYNISDNQIADIIDKKIPQKWIPRIKKWKSEFENK